MEGGSMMASGASYPRPLCRYFARGSCPWGQSCLFSHDRKSAQVCRYFQRGFCRYGEQCRYQHIQEQSQHHRGPEPGTEPPAMTRDCGGAQSTSVDPAHSITCMAFKLPKVEVEVEEKDKKNIPTVDFQPQGAALDPDSSDPIDAVVHSATGTDPAKVPAELGAAAALITPAALRAQSEGVVCGICMDRVYEKALPEERLFGILPNCSHAYCVGCIRKWRRSRDFQSAVIKACPECRIASSYYIPHKYWITDGAEKEKLISTFKARTGKIRCKFFNRGHCPFRSECIYLHKLPARQLTRHRRQQPRMPAAFIFSSSESSDEEDDEWALEWALTLAMVGTEFCYSSYLDEMFLLDFSDSD